MVNALIAWLVVFTVSVVNITQNANSDAGAVAVFGAITAVGGMAWAVATRDDY